MPCVRHGFLTLGLAVLLAPPTSAQLVFNFTNAGGATPQMVAGFQQAAARWSAVFTDNITVNVTINGQALGAGVIGSTSNQTDTFTYAAVRTAMINDATSADDLSSTAALQAGPAINMLINRTSNNPNGSGSATPYFDNNGNANNTTIRLSRANQKALGLRAGNNTANDGSITFNTNFAFDFDPSDGISPGQMDFVGVATHEIGHLLGFFSGVDILDGNSPPVGGPFLDSQFTFVNTLDLFRFSTRSIGTGGGVGVIDWTADNTVKFFSVNGGTTAIANYSNGRNFGDGQQASHWKDNLGIGIMDPTAAFGELLVITENDLRAFDVIGYNRVSAVPEPTSLLLVSATGGVLAVYKRRRKAKARDQACAAAEDVPSATSRRRSFAVRVKTAVQ